MVKNIKAAIRNARDYMDASVTGSTEGAMPVEATAWALIAIAEAMLLEAERVGYRAEVEEMRQERESRQRY